VAEPALAPLTDLFAMPAWLPWSNVFSIGDLLIGAGVAVAIAAAMRTGRRAAPAAD
jgi:multisubunit Na+/H+ antiporter MnhE subunit